MEKEVLEPMGLFATPASVEALEHYVSQFSGSEAVVAMTVMGMTWNLCAELVNGNECDY